MSSCQYPTGTGATGSSGSAGPVGPTGATGGLTSRTSVSKTTAALANNASETGTIAIAKSFIAMRVVVSGPARVRLYSTVAQRDADFSRPFTSSLLDPPFVGTMHGCLLDLFLTAGTGLTFTLSPEVQGSNDESSVSSAIAYTVTNLSVGAAITFQIFYFPLEV